MGTPSDRTTTLSLCLAVCVVVIAVGTGWASEAGEGAHQVDSAAQMKDFGWRVLNFAVLAALLGWAIAKAQVKKALNERQVKIERSLREAEQSRDAAEQKLREYSGKLEHASREIEEMRGAMLRESEQEKQRIIAEARAAAEKIAGQATLSAEHEVLKARSALQAEAGRLAVQLAATKLAGAIGKEDHDLYVDDYLKKVEQFK
ncbi:F0F1 ATP synthase subunit B family protein [Pelobacter propionicus]|uniref:ATP synthase subunit b n=1 Tax=Pelobacter propionicus (strain DSM 2379 / NBRC 103807 / OttBd1) TaxID=338966 RepID=ATPF_PELPD|nr:ATP synthase F0 subunit B [Pelobacter propionicus]A1ALL3.1 RecName: Full=ATP synthase subunit b; AltName: Full=ATP synthase F(0) sector subunit b; AltName: Full=ATPase subunit I; AltName: Full=F-type ATPase subunit b; Short=F-ATPase subunit b [Pelobacter propionicus DSM 2379]ABK98233.1 H+-transporting two-sector ATPase, B/B' subunit [Pelobacter propionicus DSM 2379]ABK99118.1 H+-transporting two-sector ATPase, B/B' subunit [Pelobacter propionicus DSM 2379]